MSTFVKKYPRARVAPHPTLNGWTVDILMGAKARPSRIKATYATIPFAIKAANAKLGIPASTETLETPAVADTTDAGIGYGICVPCKRPLRKAGMTAAEYPGTVAKRRDGLCQSCAIKQARESAA